MPTFSEHAIMIEGAHSEPPLVLGGFASKEAAVEWAESEPREGTWRYVEFTIDRNKALEASDARADYLTFWQ